MGAGGEEGGIEATLPTRTWSIDGSQGARSILCKCSGGEGVQDTGLYTADWSEAIEKERLMAAGRQISPRARSFILAGNSPRARAGSLRHILSRCSDARVL